MKNEVRNVFIFGFDRQFDEIRNDVLSSQMHRLKNQHIMWLIEYLNLGWGLIKKKKKKAE